MLHYVHNGWRINCQWSETTTMMASTLTLKNPFWKTRRRSEMLTLLLWKRLARLSNSPIHTIRWENVLPIHKLVSKGCDCDWADIRIFHQNVEFCQLNNGRGPPWEERDGWKGIWLFSKGSLCVRLFVCLFLVTDLQISIKNGIYFLRVVFCCCCCCCCCVCVCVCVCVLCVCVCVCVCVVYFLVTDL